MLSLSVGVVLLICFDFFFINGTSKQLCVRDLALGCLIHASVCKQAHEVDSAMYPALDTPALEHASAAGYGVLANVQEVG